MIFVCKDTWTIIMHLYNNLCTVIDDMGYSRNFYESANVAKRRKRSDITLHIKDSEHGLGLYMRDCIGISLRVFSLIPASTFPPFKIKQERKKWIYTMILDLIVGNSYSEMSMSETKTVLMCSFQIDKRKTVFNMSEDVAHIPN